MTKISYIRGLEKPRQFLPGDPNRLDLAQYDVLRENRPQVATPSRGFALVGIALLYLLIKN